MSGEKYSIEPNDKPPSKNLSFIRSRSVQDVEATVSSVEFTTETKDRLKPNGEFVSKRKPKVQVEFEAERTSFSSNFIFDPLVSGQVGCGNENKFTSLVSSAYVEWENFDEVIGSTVTLKSPYKSTNVLIQEPLGSHNYSVLSQFETSKFYKDGLSNSLVNIFVNLVTNKSYGRAKIQDFDVRKDKRAKVYFELKSGDTFSRSFKIGSDSKKSPNEEKFSLFDAKSSRYGKKNYGMLNMSPPEDRIYDFWNLFEDSLGYIPGDSDYGKIIGEEVPVFYRSKWRVEK